MIFVIMLLLYCVLAIIRRILMPRLIPRRFEYVFENKLCFIIICCLYIAYKMLLCNMNINDIRHFSYDSSK